MPGIALSSTLSTVVICDGSPNKVETVQAPGESIADFVQRHKDEVAAARAACSGTAVVEPSTYTTPVDCNGSIGDVITMQSPGQSLAEFFAVHNNAVRIAVNDCP